MSNNNKMSLVYACNVKRDANENPISWDAILTMPFDLDLAINGTQQLAMAHIVKTPGDWALIDKRPLREKKARVKKVTLAK